MWNGTVLASNRNVISGGRLRLLEILVVTTFAGILVAGSVLLTPARAQAYPQRPITFYSPAAAGSASDVQARVLARILSRILKQPIDVIDMAGGSGAVSEAQLQQRPADGYTMLFEPASQLAYTVAKKMIPYKFDQFVGVAGVGGDAVALVVRTNDQRFQTLAEFVKYARAHPDTLTVGGFGAAGQFEATYADLVRAANIKARYIPYNGGAKIVVALLGGQIAAAVTAPSNVITNNQIRILAIASEGTFAPLPSTPTFLKLGYRVVQPVTRGFYAKAGTPASVVEKFSQAVQEALRDPQWVQFAKREVIETKFMGPAAWHSYTASVVDTWQRLLARGNN